jgi:hypothetical protein
LAGVATVHAAVVIPIISAQTSIKSRAIAREEIADRTPFSEIEAIVRRLEQDHARIQAQLDRLLGNK